MEKIEKKTFIYRHDTKDSILRSELRKLIDEHRVRITDLMFEDRGDKRTIIIKEDTCCGEERK